MDDKPTTDCYVSYYISQGSQIECNIQNIYKQNSNTEKLLEFVFREKKTKSRC